MIASILSIVLAITIIKLAEGQNCGSCTVVGRFCYTFNSNTFTNAAAVTQCSNAGGRLPFFSSAQDVTDFATYATRVSLGASWLGYWNYNPHTAANPGNWVDQQGNIAPYTYWSGGQPDNWGGGEPCTQTYPGGYWNDIPCGNTFQIVCQCQCARPSGPFMTVTGGVPPAINSMITVTCDTCYEVIGPSTSTCIYDGSTVVWNNQVLSSYCQRIQCPNIFNGTTGTFPAAPYYSCTDYNYTCISNYIVDPRNAIVDTFTCSAIGGWNKPFIPCIITCPVLPNSGKVYVTQGTSANLIHRPIVGTVATFTCATGWTLQGPTSATCQADGSWSNSYPTCNRTGSVCDDIFDTTTGVVSSAAPFMLGSQYNFTCMTNMILWPANSVVQTYTCQLDTEWDQPFTSCTNTCPPIATLPNGVIQQDTILNVLGRSLAGTKVGFICNSGYIQIGSTNSTCQADGTWSDAIPNCLRLNCSNVFGTGSTVTGSVSTSILQSNTIYTFTCNPMFYLPNKNTITQDYICQANATWNLPFEPCVPVCSAITTLANGQANGGGQNTIVIGGVSSGTQVTFSCNTGFALVGSKSSKCQPDGSWSDSVPYCSATKCPWIFDKTGEIDATTFLPTNSYYFSCMANTFVRGSLDSGTEYYCDETGNWEPKFTSCSYSCPKFTLFYHGQVSYQLQYQSESIFSGDVAIFSCDVGYTLNGTYRLTCNESGGWSGEVPTCTNAKCVDIWSGTTGIWSSSPPFYALDSVEYSCPANTIADNNTNLKLHCNVFGLWDRPLASCIKTCKLPDLTINHGRIVFPVNNRVIFTDRVLQSSTIYVSCDKTYTASQPTSITCMPDGNWSSEIPKCYAGDYNPWWWPIILALMIILVISLGICITCFIKKKKQRSETNIHPVKVNQIYYS